MLPKKPTLLFAACNPLNSLPSTLPQSSTSSKRKRASTRPCTHCNNASKLYATIANDDHPLHERHHPHHAWPLPPPNHPNPTPYQILSIERKAPYTKLRFHELVKLYHPDRNLTTSLPPAVRMERYRLIIAAHDILSDPTKRSAYDRFGAGWNGRAAVRGANDEAAGPFSQNWTQTSRDDPIWGCATWEDWEKYHHEKAKARVERTEGAAGVNYPVRTGLYLTNGYFLMIVMALGLMGSTANYTRATSEGQLFVDQRDHLHDRAVKELRQVKQDALMGGSRSSRVEWFVRNREATLGLAGSDAQVLREEKVDRLLPERDVCRSEGVSSEVKG